MSKSIPQKRSVLITGCSEGGIGDALAKQLHKRGLLVFATGRTLSKLDHLRDLGIITLQLDVSDEQSISTALQSVAAQTGGTLSFLINNAGIGYGAPLIESEMERCRQLFETNVLARASLTQACLPLLMQAKGTVVNIGSIAAVYPGVWQGMYAASCAAQHMWSDVLRLELAPLGVQVVLIVTGAITTNFLRNKSGCHLKDDSLYAAAKRPIEAYMDGSSIKGNFVDVDAYAVSVVTNILNSSPKPRFWTGGMASLIWAASTFLWATVWDQLLQKDTGLAELNANRSRS